jgi:alpha-glucosidase
MSGFSFVGSDIGGFAEQPSGELYTRWIQLGVFHPFCRTHSSGDHGDQEPYSFDTNVTNIVRKFIEIRYQLLPYLYTAFWQYANEGAPILKSLMLFDQKDPQTHYRNDEFIYGDKILICPILEPNAKGRRMYFPIGNWYNFWDENIVKGGEEKWVDADIESMPIFIKEGAIIPKYPVQQYVGEKIIEELVLDVYFKEGKEKSKVYEDANDGYDYKKGRFSLRNFRLVGKKDSLTIQQFKEGTFITSYETFKILLHGVPFIIKEIEIDNEKVDLANFNTKENSIVVSKEFTEIHIIG